MTPLLPVIGKGDKEYLIENILSSRQWDWKVQYLAKLVEYYTPKWKLKEFVYKSEVVEDFHNWYLDKSKSHLALNGTEALIGGLLSQSALDT